MGLTISNLGLDIKITDGSNNSWLFPKEGTAVYQFGDKVKLVKGELKIDILYSTVDSPVVADASALFNFIEDLKQAGGASIDSATTKVAGSATSGELVGANADRRGVWITNSVDKKVFILVGTGTAVADDDHIIEVDKSIYLETTEAIQFVTEASPTGNVIVTELL